MNKGLIKHFGVLVVFGCCISCHGQSSWPTERGLIITTFNRYTYGRQHNIQLRHIPIYPGYEGFAGQIPGLNFTNHNVHFLSVDIDYGTKCIYLYDAYFRTIVLGTGYNKDLNTKNMTITPIHTGVSRGTIQLAVDWLSHTVYWADSVFRWIMAAPGQKDKIDNGYYRIIADTHLDAPDGITLDPLAGYLFWSDNGYHPKIERSDMQGRNRHTIVSTYLKSPLSLEADIFEKRIYWIDSFTEAILSATYDGADIISIQRIPNSNLLDLAVFRGSPLHTKCTFGILRCKPNIIGPGQTILMYRLAWRFNRVENCFEPMEVLYISDIENGNIYTLNKTQGLHLGKQESSTIRLYYETIYGLAVYGAENQPMKDKDYCAEKNCEHLCITTENGAECLCSDGYSLNSDNKCQETVSGFHKALVVANETHVCVLDIRAFSQASYGYVCKFSVSRHGESSTSTLPPKSTTAESFTDIPENETTVPVKQPTPGPTAPPLDNITNIDLDIENRILFIATAGNELFKRPIDLPIENDAVELIVVASGTISGIAYDALDSDNLYWCESDTGSVRVVNVRTKASEDIIGNGGLTQPRDIVVMLKQRNLAVLTGTKGSMEIRTVAIDGGEFNAVTSGRLEIASFTFDNEKEMFYYIAGTYLYSVAYDGSSSKFISYTVDDGAYNLIVYQNYITWVYPRNAGDMYVRATDLQSLRIVTNHMFNSTSVNIVDMKVLDPKLQSINVSSPCTYENGGCSQICVTKYVNDTMILVCECRLGYKLDEDNATCITIGLVYDNFILAADWTNDELLLFSLDTGNVSAMPDTENDEYKGVYFDAEEKRVIWAENYDNNIYSANLNGSDKQIVSYLGFAGYAYRFDKDMTTGNLYYTAYYDSYIGMVTPFGESLILNSAFTWTNLGDIVVHPGKGWLYFTASGYFSNYVGRADMDGENLVELITGNHVDEPDGLAIDFINDHLYWSDATYDTIQRCNLDGDKCVTIVNMTGTYQGEEIRDLVTDGDFLYYSAYKKDHIVRLDLKEPYNRTIVGRNPDVGKLDTIAFYSSANKNIQSKSSACQNRDGLGDCSTICFPTSMGRTCGCENGESLKADGRTCSNIYQCTELISQTVTLSPGKEEMINVTFSNSCRRHLGDTCHYTCPDNYIPSHDTLLSCTNVGWDLESETLCQELRCPENIENGRLGSNCKREVGNTCGYKCNKGFVETTEILVCLENGTYQIPEDELCTAYKCDDDISNGRLDGSCTREVGVSCNYSCNEYYTYSRTDGLQITCQTDGWSSNTANLCKDSTCTDHSLVNGKIKGECQKKVGHMCGVECNTGYINTTDAAVCKSDLMWHPTDICSAIKCPKELPNGAIPGACNYTIGAVCNFKCNDGYRSQIQDETVTCKAIGQWDIKPCTEIKCPATIIDGKLDADCNQKVGEKCQFECNDGFINATEMAVCTDDGTYHVSRGELCTPFKCSGDIKDGKLVDGCSRTIGSTCGYKCDKYFTPTVNNMEITCRANGWDPISTDICKESVCDDASLSNGNIIGDCQKKIGETCMFKCNQGYVNATSNVVCQDGGVWNPKDSCTAFKCSGDIDSGKLVDGCSRTIDSTCGYKCDKYFTPTVNSMEVTCRANGWYPNSTALCKESVCDDASLYNGNIIGDCQKKIGETCIFTCNQGYVNTTFNVVCQEGGVWNPKDSCTAFTCSGDIDNGKFVDECSRTIGSTCGYKCDKYFTPSVNSMKVTCRANGWDPNSTDLCKESVCDDASLSNGNIIGDCQKKIGETCIFTCNQGYVNTTSNVVCQEGGDWNPKYSCTGLKCSQSIKNGQLAPGCTRQIGSSCKFSCSKYFSPRVTNMDITCQEDGWSPSSSDLCTESGCQDSSFPHGKVVGNCNRKVGDVCTVQCREGYDNTTASIVCGNDYTWHPKDTCKVMQCAPLIPNGEITGVCDFKIEATCSFKCNDGFTANTVHTKIKCGMNAQWNVTSGLCLESTCTDTSLHNGILTDKCSKRVGETCTFQCDDNYVNTTEVIVCKDDYMWHPVTACAPTKCPTIISNGDITGSCDHSIGNTCNFTCKEGYKPATLHTNTTCNDTGSWDFEEALCIGVSQTSRTKGLPIPGVTAALAILGIVIIALIVAIAIIIRRRRISYKPKAKGRSASDVSFENPRYFRSSDLPIPNKDEQPDTSNDTTQMQTIFSEEEAPVDYNSTHGAHAAEPLPDVAQLEITDDKVILTQDSWLKEREKGNSEEC